METVSHVELSKSSLLMALDVYQLPVDQTRE